MTMDSLEPRGAFGAKDGGDLGDLFRVHEPDIKAAIEPLSGDTEFFYYSSHAGRPSDHEVVLVVGAETLHMLKECHDTAGDKDPEEAAWANVSWLAHTCAESHKRAMAQGDDIGRRVVEAINKQLPGNPISGLPGRPDLVPLMHGNWNGRSVWMYYFWVRAPGSQET